MPDFSLEGQVNGVVIGVDEAGRGPWAGPVVAGAAYITEGQAALFSELNDSKKLTAKKREVLYELLHLHAKTGLGIADVKEIDQLNILGATKLAMQRAVDNLVRQIGTPKLILIDGNQPPELPYPVQSVIKGDSKSMTIAAASIIAKVSRDLIMQDLANQHPHYGWEKNAGYGTKAHQDGLKQHGITIHHRKSFKPIKALAS